MAAAYSLRDLVRGPSLLSLLRLPLAIAFVVALEHDGWPWPVLAASAASDVADGWYARRSAQVTKTGALVDAVMDKLFVAVVVISLVATDRLSVLEALGLGTREAGELALAGRVAAAGGGRLTASRHALPLGKATTILQYVTIGAAIARLSGVAVLAALTAIAGVLAAGAYWRDEEMHA